MAWTNVYRRYRITWSDVHGVDVEFSSSPNSGDKSRLRFYSGPDRRPVVVDAAVKTDVEHGTCVKSATRALGNASPTLTTSRVVASGRWTDRGVPDHREEGAYVQP